MTAELLRLADLAMIDRLVRCGSLAAAARAMGMSTAGLARHLAALEVALGYRILVRGPRGVVPTARGRALAEGGARLLALARQAAGDAAREASKPSGPLHVVMAPLEACRLLAPHLPEFRRACPEVSLRFSLREPDRDDLRPDVDIAVGHRADLRPDWIAAPLLAHAYQVCAGPAYVARHGVPPSADMLAAHHWVALRGEGGEVRVRRLRLQAGGGSHLRRCEVEVQPRLLVGDAPALVSAVEAGLGLGVVPVALLAQEDHRSTLCPVLPEWRVLSPAGAAGLFALARPYPEQSAQVRAFLAFLRQLPWHDGIPAERPGSAPVESQELVTYRT